MLRSKIILLPIVSFPVFVFLLLILFGPLREGRGTAFGFALGCVPLCWLCSVACGFYAVKRKEAVLPKLEKTVSIILSGLTFFSFMASWILLNPMTTDDVGMAVAGVVYLSGFLWCLLSCLMTIIVIVRERDPQTWVLFVVQIFWAIVSFYFLSLAVEISDAC